MVQKILRQEVKEILDSGKQFFLIEALPEKYYLEGHLPGAVQMDYKEVDLKADKLPEDKNQMIVVYCASRECQNSIITARQLDSLGYSYVYEYVEGKQDWIEAGYPVETKIK